MTPHSNSRVNFIYKLGGDVGEIDVFELAPTLLSLGQLIQESNRVLNPGGQEIAVNVKPFREGSFIVDVVLFPDSTLQQLIDLVRHTSLDQVLYMLKALGIVTGATTGVVGVMKLLKGKPKVDELKPGEYRYASDDNSITVSKDVHTLLQNPVITQNVYNVYGKPLEKEKIDAVESYLKDEEKLTKVVVRKDEAPALKEFASAPPQPEPVQGEELAKENISTVFLNPKRGAFEGDGMQWSFHRGSDVLTATIKDPAFLAKVASGEIRPNHHDLMEVELVERQRVIGTQVKPPVYEIIKVVGYKVGGPAQQSLLPPAPEETPPTSQHS